MISRAALALMAAAAPLATDAIRPAPGSALGVLDENTLRHLTTFKMESGGKDMHDHDMHGDMHGDMHDDDVEDGEVANVSTEAGTPLPAEDCSTIAQLAETTPDLSTLFTAVSAAPTVAADLSSLTEEFTVFAPSNDAFAVIPQEPMDALLNLTDVLTFLLEVHIVPGAISAADLMDGDVLETVNGGNLTVSIKEGTVYITAPGDGGTMATVVTPDVGACNGIVHVIDSVLLPGTATPAMSPTAVDPLTPMLDPVVPEVPLMPEPATMPTETVEPVEPVETTETTEPVEPVVEPVVDPTEEPAEELSDPEPEEEAVEPVEDPETVEPVEPTEPDAPAPTTTTRLEQTASVEESPSGSSGGFTFMGDLTYYGGAGVGGHCTQDYVPPGFTTVALNNPQYANGAGCGMCVHACFDNLELGQGERCFDAIVDDECPECKSGDLDLGESGSGRWPVEWKIIECPATSLKFSTQGSNPFYAKVKAQGGPSSVESMTCNGMEGQLTPDAFFVFQSGSGDFACGMDCEVTFGNGFGTGSGKVAPDQLGNACNE